VRVGYGAALRAREFRALFAGQAVSILGTSVAGVALTILVFRLTGSPFLSALTFALGFLPYLVGGTLLSGLVDRVRPRRLVSACDAASAVVAAAMAWHGEPVGALLALMLVLGTLSSVASGSRGALVRATVSDDAYVPARSLLKLASQGAQIGGNALAGLLVVAIGTRGTILVNAASFGVSAAAVRFGTRDRELAGTASGGLLRDSLRGARGLLARRRLRALLLLGWLVPFFAVAPEALAAPYVASKHGSAALVGVWLVALPLGLVAGDVAGVRWLTAEQQQRLVYPAAAAGFVPYLAFALHPSLPVSLALLFVAGACGMYSLGLDARVRDAAPLELFARTMALSSAGLMTLQGIGFAVAGAVAEAAGAAGAIAIAGACGLLAAAAIHKVEA